MRAGITGAFGVTGKNENGGRGVEFCAKRRLCVGNTYFKYKSLHSTQGLQGSKMEWR